MTIKHSPETYRLEIFINNNRYYPCTISVNRKKNEFFYLAHFSEKCNDNLIYLNSGQNTARPQKISFHNKTAHIKTNIYKNGKTKEIKIYKEEDFILLSGHDKINFLLVDAFRSQEDLTNLIPTQPPQFKTTHTLSNTLELISNDFSIALCILPRNISTQRMLMGSKIMIQNMEIPLIIIVKKNSTCRINIFDNHDLLIFIFPYAPFIDQTNHLCPNGPIRLWNIAKPVESLANMIMQELKRF